MEQNNIIVLNDEKREIQVQHAEPAIESMIMDIRGQQVILDHDLASLYDVETKALNQAVKRNIERFPSNFRFQLSEDEMIKLVTDCDRLEKLKHSSSLPFAFTEQGVAMLSAVLHSQTAIRVSIQIMDAFVAMRHFLASHTSLFQRVETLEHNQLLLFDHQSENDRRLGEVFQRLDNPQLTPKEGVFFDGQIFDAYAFASDLIRSARERIVLIDNYIDESALLMLAKRKEGVSAEIVTRRISELLTLDLERHNRQYPTVNVRESDRYHDRFLIIDNMVYHLGASLKDLGKKLFAFCRMEIRVEDICNF
jgi:hypothetical protein